MDEHVEHLKSLPAKPRRYTARWQCGLLNTALCCDGGISGCYAPTGAHTEKPLEIGLRVDAGFISIYEAEASSVNEGMDDMVEIENAEVILTYEGELMPLSITATYYPRIQTHEDAHCATL